MDRDQNPLPSPKRQSRFVPKAPPRRKLKHINPKTESKDNDDDAKALLQRVNEHLGKLGHKPEKNSSVQVTFTNNVASPSTIRSFGLRRPGNNITSSSGSRSTTVADEEKIISCSPATAIQDGTSSSVNVVESSHKKKEKYRERWDYKNSYYPVTLPLRPPYSGDPELLNEKEFGEVAENSEYDENTLNSASELGLLEESDKPQMLLLQLPNTLPLETPQKNRPVTTAQTEKEKEKVGVPRTPLASTEKGKVEMGEPRPPRTRYGMNVDRGLDNLPRQHMGKLLVYKSGAIKWKIGEVIYDVAPGVRCNFAQDVVVMNTTEKHICTLGEVSKRAVVTPDMDLLLNDNLKLGSN